MVGCPDGKGSRTKKEKKEENISPVLSLPAFTMGWGGSLMDVTRLLRLTDVAKSHSDFVGRLPGAQLKEIWVVRALNSPLVPRAVVEVIAAGHPV